MSFEISELLSLYDVAAISLPERDEELAEEIIEKAARLFGACRLAVALETGEGRRNLVRWGFRQGEEPPEAAGDTSFAYRFTRGAGGSLYLETNRSIAERQRKLLTIFAKRLEELISRRVMEQRVRESEQEKSLILNSVLELLMFQDKSHRIIWANRAAAEFAARPPIELRGSLCYDALHRRKSPCEGCPADKALETGKPEEARISAGEREFFVKAYPVKGKDGSIERLVVVGVDVTESARAEGAFRTIFHSASDAIFIHDRHGRIIDVNHTMLRMYGLETREEALSFPLVSYYSAPDAPVAELPERWERALRGEEQTFEWKARRPKDGSVFDAEVTLKRIALGDSYLLLATVRDITQRKQETELLQSLFRHSPIGMYIAAEGRFLMVNPQFARLTGYSEEELIGKGTLELVVPEDREKVRDSAIKMLKGEKRGPYTFRIHTKSGGLRWIEETVTSIWHGGKRVTLGNIVDVTQKKRFEERLKYLSAHDGLTGLYNRAFFEEELRRLSAGRDYPVTIILGDINGLKLINDTLGHDKGDRLLIACAQAFRRALRSSDIVARVGGDEFVVLLPRTDERSGRKILERIQQSVERHNREQPSLPLSISFGMATAESPDHPLKEAYKRADDLMYEAKHELGREFQSKLIANWLEELLQQLQVTEEEIALKQGLCRMLGERAGLSPKQLSDLSLLVKAQDLGMVGMPERILRRRKPLSKRDQKLLRQHPERGYRLALFSKDLAGIAELILKHHESWDGSGYPCGLRGEEIPIECRILAITESFARAASGKGSPEAALETLRSRAGSQLDPELTEIFIKAVPGSSFLNRAAP